MSTEVIIYSGLLSGALAFLSSLVATFLLYRTNDRQQKLLRQLQQEKLDFDSDAAKKLEKYKSDLGEQKLLFEAELKRQENLYGQQVANMFLATEKSQIVTQQTLSQFDSMVEKSKFLKDREFLDEFSKAIVDFKAFNDSTRGLENILRKKDSNYLSACRDNLLEILLGMRLEEDRRKLEDYLKRVDDYQVKLESMRRVLRIKYKRVLQPRMQKLPAKA